MTEQINDEIDPWLIRMNLLALFGQEFIDPTDDYNEFGDVTVMFDDCE